MVFQARPELAKNVETNICGHRDAKADGTISCAGGAPRLPFARNEGRAGSATDAREGERPVAIVVTRKQRAYDGGLGSPEEPGFTVNEVALVLNQRGG